MTVSNLIQTLFFQKSTKCFDHTQLAVETTKEETKTNKKTITNKQTNSDNDKLKSDKSVCKKECGTKKDLSVSSQLKMTHNKSEIGHKVKKCSLHRKDKSAKKTDGLQNIPLAEHILLKTF